MAADHKPTSKRMPLLMPDDFSELNLCGWRVEEAEQDKSNPLIEGDMPWDGGGVGNSGTFLKDPIDGLWKAWANSSPPKETWANWRNGWSQKPNRHLCYYESVDGVNWTKPALPDSAYGEHKQTNIIFSYEKFGLQAYASVFVRPENAEWPYEMFVLQNSMPDTKSPHGEGYQRYRSKDGKSWEWVSGPITGCILGDLLFVYAKGELSDEYPYLGYYRTAEKPKPDFHQVPWENGMERIAFRCYSHDGMEWIKDTGMTVARDEKDHKDTEFMECIPVKVPGGYIAMQSIYHGLIQTIDLRMAASRDGKRWWYPDRRPCMPNPPLGEYGSGIIWQSRKLIEENGKLYLYYSGTEGPHRQVSDTRAPSVDVNYLDTAINASGHVLPFNAAVCRASWDFDRMYALASNAGGPTIAQAVTKPGNLRGRSLKVNIITRPAKKSSKPNCDEGYLQAELLDAIGRPIPGFTRDDCPQFRGDHRTLAVTWQGGAVAPAGAHKAMFYLKRVFLYGFAFDPA